MRHLLKNTQHIIYIYDDDIKNIIAKYYKINPKDVLFSHNYGTDNNIRVCYKIVFDNEQK